MARGLSLYPASPADVPETLTQSSSQYRLRVFVVLASVVFFFTLYLGLLIGSAYLVYWGLTTPLDIEPGRRGGSNRGLLLIFRILLPITGGLMFLFLFKGLFKRQRALKSYDIEITEKDHPRVWDFIGRLCEETGAPLPARVFVNFEANACVCYDGSILNLFWPAPKHLKIGLGLINCINLTEFKALLAHEFGHMAQRSMKLGTYVYTSSRLMGDLVWGRDFFDDLLDSWCRLDIRISAVAWVFTFILWLLRQALGLLFKGIFFLDKALSRQMEFNADLVAVSVTGSDAPVHLLKKSGFAEETLNQAIQDIQAAADHHLYTRDLFFHQNHALPFLRRVRKEPRLGEIPDLPDDPKEETRVFDPKDDEYLPHMWLTHPPNSQREENCKETYIRTAFDERSPWLLFDESTVLREKVTKKFYRVVMKIPKDVILLDAEEIQSFIDEEHAESTYDPKYHGVYDGRLILPGDLDTLAQESATQHATVAQLKAVQAGLYNVEVKHRIQLHNKRLEEFDLLTAVAHNHFRPKNDELDFRGETYDLKDAKKLLKKVEKDLDDDQKWLEQLDRNVFLTHYQMALRLSPPLEGGAGGVVAEDLFQRYRFHLGVQDIWKKLRAQEGSVAAALDFLQGKRRLEQGEFQEALGIFQQAHQTLE